MKALSRILILILSLALAISLIACNNTPCTEHEDTNPADGKCDSCGAELTPDEGGEGEGEGGGSGGEGDEPAAELTLIADGEANFQFVLGSGLPSSIRSALNTFKNKMKSTFDITVNFVDDVAGNEMECEVLVGPVSSRGETYYYDMYSLGAEGSAIKTIGKKIIVSAGTTDALLETLNVFFEDYLGFDEDADEFSDVTVKPEDGYEEIQDDYDIASISVLGVDLHGYTISYPKDAKNYFKAQATALQDTLYYDTGYYLPLSQNAETDRCIAFRHVDKSEIESGYGFEVSVEGTKLVIKCAHPNSLETAMTKFIDETVYKAEDGAEIDFAKDYKWAKVNIGVVKYKDYDVDPSGIRNSYAGIKAAHDFANEGGQKVVAERGAIYLISDLTADGRKYGAITIKTDTDWNGATFIFDDTNLDARVDEKNNKNIFSIAASTAATNVSASKLLPYTENGLSRDTTKLDLGIGYPALIKIRDDNHKIYIRYGGNQNSGNPQSEILIVDAEGNIDPTTPLLFDYSSVTGISVHRIDDAPITVGGAKFITRASIVNLVDENCYLSRGIQVGRHNTTVKDIVHEITGQKEKNEDVNGVPFIGHAYGGFIQVGNAANVTLDHITFQAKVYYLQGTYDLTMNNSHNVVVKNCDQSNFFEEGSTTVPNIGKCWGVMESDFCKNITYDNCKLTRFDAHCGIVNGKILNSEVHVISIIGGGDILIENTKIYHRNTNLISLRGDYGSTFRGTITLRNCSTQSAWKENALKSIIDASIANHDFGYGLYFPNIVIDNLEIENPAAHVNIISHSAPKCSHKSTDGGYMIDLETEIGKCSSCKSYVYRTITNEPNLHLNTVQLSDGRENQSIYHPPAYVKVINNADKSYKMEIYEVPFFSDTEVTGDITWVPVP